MSASGRPSIVHALDQIGAILEDLAPAMRQYHQALLRQGFSNKDAVYLVNGIQQALIGEWRERSRRKRLGEDS